MRRLWPDLSPTWKAHVSELHNAGHPSPGPALDVRLTCRIGSTRTVCGSDGPQAAATDAKSVRAW